jgi:hypothetical protein
MLSWRWATSVDKSHGALPKTAGNAYLSGTKLREKARERENIGTRGAAKFDSHLVSLSQTPQGWRPHKPPSGDHQILLHHHHHHYQEPETAGGFFLYSHTLLPRLCCIPSRALTQKGCRPKPCQAMEKVNTTRERNTFALTVS